MRDKLVLSGLLIALLAGCGEQQTPTELWEQGITLTEQEEFNQAEETFKELLSRETIPDTLRAKTNFTLADLYLNNMKKYQDAQQRYRKVVEEYPASEWGAKAQFMLGYMYANYVNDYEQAKEEYQRFLDIYPTDPLAEAVDFEMRHLGESLDDLDFLPAADSLGAAGEASLGMQEQ